MTTTTAPWPPKPGLLPTLTATGWYRLHERQRMFYFIRALLAEDAAFPFTIMFPNSTRALPGFKKAPLTTISQRLSHELNYHRWAYVPEVSQNSLQHVHGVIAGPNLTQRKARELIKLVAGDPRRVELAGEKEFYDGSAVLVQKFYTAANDEDPAGAYRWGEYITKNLEETRLALLTDRSLIFACQPIRARAQEFHAQDRAERLAV